MQKNSFVLDVNIWISLFLKDKFSELSQKIITHDLVLYRSDTLTEELNDVIRRQKIVKQLIMPVAEYIEFYKQATALFNPITLFNACQDPKDNYLLWFGHSVWSALFSQWRQDCSTNTNRLATTITNFNAILAQPGAVNCAKAFPFNTGRT